MNVFLRSILFVSILIFSDMVCSGECEKETSRKSIRCLEGKIDTLFEKFEAQEKKLSLLETNRENHSAKPTEKSNSQSHHAILGKVENGDYIFQFEQCNATNTKNEIICTFYVTNNSDEHIVGISTDWARLFLDSGSSSAADEIYLGNIGGASRKYQSIDYKFSLPSSVPIRGKAIYKDIEGDAISLFQFKMAPNSDINNKVSVDFKNLPLVSGY
jgi:hypothetical protein